MNLKEQLYELCKLYVQKREETITTIISSAQKSLNSETKSSAGDKHETGRAMIQLEMEKAGQQLQGITQMKEILAKVDVSKENTIVHLGSLVTTNTAYYFLSISAGALVIDKKQYFAISVSSPIGRLLLGKKVNDTISFNGKSIKIKAVS